MKVKNINEAWNEANKIIPNDYLKDEEASARAGYPIYRSTINHYDYICDLGDRLEVNLANGQTVNIWIEEDKEEVITEYEIIKSAYSYILMKWSKENERLEACPTSPIAKHWERKYWKQLEVLHERILQFEDAQSK